MINCVIVDDEPLAREGMMDYVAQTDFLNLIGTAANPLELTAILKQEKVDLIFLDIQMPKMSGIDFLKITQNPPMVIITTAFRDYAVESFQLNVMDYLVKPIKFDRFFKAAVKARDYYNLLTGNTGTEKESTAKPDYFFIKCGNRHERILFDEILYAEGLQNYVTIYTVKGKYLSLMTLKSLEEGLNGHAFIRVHKSFIAAVNKVDGIEGNELFIRESRIPIGRSYRDEVLSKLFIY